MTATEQNTTEKQKPTKPIQILRERRGGVPPELVQHNKELAKVRKSVVAALKEGHKTAPEIAQATGIASDIVFWHLVSMKKYGKVAEGQPSGDYFEYELTGK